MPVATDKLSCIVYQGNILYRSVRFLSVRQSFIHGDAFLWWNIISTLAVCYILSKQKKEVIKKNGKKKWKA
jgi:hypothetical protein